MSIARLSVSRPVTVFMVFAGIILLGLISWGRLPQELFPSITYPQITVVTSYENAAPEEIESLVTKVIEEAVGTVNNVKRINSISKEGTSLVMIEFNWGANMDFAALNVREKIDLVKEKLPREAQEPVVMKYNPFDLPVMNLAVTGNIPSKELREICRKYIKDSIEKLEGVGSVTITGGDEREILVEIDQPRLRASQISIVSVIDSLKAANLNYPAGTIKESFYEYLIRTMGQYQKVAEIQETPTALDLPEEDAQTEKEKEEKEAQKGRRLVYLKDIAKVKDTVKEKTSISRYNAKESISLVIRKQSGTTAMSVVSGVKKEIKKLLEEKLPKGIAIQITYDQSKFIKEAIINLRDAGIQGGILSFIVLFVFLWEIKASLFIITAIPICVFATAVMMYFAGISINMMSLGGLALGVGMVVDNANIVIENIYRRRRDIQEEFKTSIEEGTTEMISAIIGSTLTNIAVFLPFAFVVGIAGQIFKQLSFTISFSLIGSILVAMTLIPVLILVFRESKADARIMNRVNAVTGQYTAQFKNFLINLLDQKNNILLAVGGLFLLSILMLLGIDRQFMPKVDQRQFIIKVDLPPGSRLETTDKVASQIERLLLSQPESEGVTINIGSSSERTSGEASTALQTMGSHQAQVLVNLKKRNRWDFTTRTTDEIIQYLKTSLEKANLERADIEYLAQETSFGTALEQGAPVAVQIKGPDLNRLSELSSILQSKFKNIKGLYGVKTSIVLPSPETKLNILKDKASLYGLSVRDIAVTAQSALKGYVATKFVEKAAGQDIDIRVRLRPEDRSDMGNLRRMLVHSPLGMEVPLSEVAYLTQGVGPTEIKRVDQQRAVLVTANVYKRGLSAIVKDIESVTGPLKKNSALKDYTIEMAGEQQRLQESFASLAFALVLAFVLVYMIMAAEFESLWQPLLIMFTVPLSLIGVAFSLFFTRTPLSIVSYLGIIMLGGIAVNNGIVLIEFVNARRKEGHTPYQAVIEASTTRLRPILMTSLTTILGLLPLALGFGQGAELQAPLALTVMGGLTSATFLTLVFIPALYLTLADKFERFEPVVAAPQEKMPAPTQTTPRQVVSPGAPEPSPIEIALSQKTVPKETLASIINRRDEEPDRIEEQETPPPPELNVRQKQLLEELAHLKKITRKDYAAKFAVSIPTAARDLKELVDKNLLIPKGPFGPGRWYELVKKNP